VVEKAARAPDLTELFRQKLFTGTFIATYNLPEREAQLMDLNQGTRDALDRWIVDGWGSDTKTDPGAYRFYQFVDQYQRDHKYNMPELEMREEIRRTAERQGMRFDEYQEREAAEYVSRAIDILGFLETTRR
jgi:hypothetical protein